MVQPLRDSRDHYEELKQIDDAMTEVEPILSIYLSIYLYIWSGSIRSTSTSKAHQLRCYISSTVPDLYKIQA